MMKMKRCPSIKERDDSCSTCLFCKGKALGCICCKAIRCCKCCNQWYGVHETCLQERIKKKLEKNPLEAQKSEFEGFMKIKCGKCKEFILYKENFSNKFSCMDLDDCEKCGLCLILFFLLLSLALLIAFAYLYEVTPNPTYKSNYIAGIVVTGVSFLIFAFLLPLMLKNKFYNFDPDSIYRHPENLKE